MGIARIDVWLANRYRLVAQQAGEVGIPQTDVMCLDVASVFNLCTGWTEALARQTDEEVQMRVLKHIEFLVGLVKPQDQLFIAVDGVPPLAMLSAQRRQRFEIFAKRKKFLQNNQCSKDDTIFNINKIAPGTDFMDEFNYNLSFFIRKKMSEDPIWQKPLVFLSDSNVHGDNKYKIMNFFRGDQENGDSQGCNRTYCIYSIAPDMPILALMTHEPHVYILRETESLKLGYRPDKIVETHKLEDYTVYHLGLLREYWERDVLSGDLEGLSLESTLEDFVFMCTFLGNDVLPRIASLHVREGGMDTILVAYRDVVVEHGYLMVPNRECDINNQALQSLVNILGSNEAELQRLKERAEIKRKRPHQEIHSDEGSEHFQMTGGCEEQLESWKVWYYQEKMLFKQGNGMARNEVVQSYLHGLIWLAAYYTKGVFCWNYCYSENFGPCMSDVKDLKDLSEVNVDYAKVSPLSVNEYIMSVLPLSDMALMPKVLQPLADDPKSSFKKIYEETKSFRRDLMGAWDQDDFHYRMKSFPARRLQKMFRSAPVEKVYPELYARDKEGKLLVFQYKKGAQENNFCKSNLPKYLCDVDAANSMVFVMDGPNLEYPEDYLGFTPKLPEGRSVERDSPPGFPSLANFTSQVHGCMLQAKYDRLGVELPLPSNSYFLVLEEARPPWPEAVKKLSEAFLGHEVLVCCPYLRKARVRGISNPLEEKPVNKDFSRLVHDERVKEAQRRYYWHKGVDLVYPDVLFLVEITASGRKILEPAQTVMFQAADGSLHCVLDYRQVEGKHRVTGGGGDSFKSHHRPELNGVAFGLRGGFKSSDGGAGGSKLLGEEMVMRKAADVGGQQALAEGSKENASDEDSMDGIGDIRNLEASIGSGMDMLNDEGDPPDGSDLLEVSDFLGIDGQRREIPSHTVPKLAIEPGGIKQKELSEEVTDTSTLKHGVVLGTESGIVYLMDDQDAPDTKHPAANLADALGDCGEQTQLSQLNMAEDGVETKVVSQSTKHDEDVSNSVGDIGDHMKNLDLNEEPGSQQTTQSTSEIVDEAQDKPGSSQACSKMTLEDGELRENDELLDSGTVAEELGISEQALCRILDSCWLEAGTKQMDIGLNICKPVSNSSLQLSRALVDALEEYQSKHLWLFMMVDTSPDAPKFNLEALFPKWKRERMVQYITAAREWVEGLDIAALHVQKNGNGSQNGDAGIILPVDALSDMETTGLKLQETGLDEVQPARICNHDMPRKRVSEKMLGGTDCEDLSPSRLLMEPGNKVARKAQSSPSSAWCSGENAGESAPDGMVGDPGLNLVLHVDTQTNSVQSIINAVSPGKLMAASSPEPWNQEKAGPVDMEQGSDSNFGTGSEHCLKPDESGTVDDACESSSQDKENSGT